MNEIGSCILTSAAVHSSVCQVFRNRRFQPFHNRRDRADATGAIRGEVDRPGHLIQKPAVRVRNSTRHRELLLTRNEAREVLLIDEKKI